jgi:predicted RNA-binding protein (virulence factor B family)
MLQFGKINQLTVNSISSKGSFLVDEEGNEVLLPKTNEKVQVSDILDVFVYIDSNGNPTASLKTPFAQVGDFAYLKAVEVLDFGAFLDLGIEKHLLVPGNQQKTKMEFNEYYLVKICLEENTNKIYGSSKLDRFVEKEDIHLDRNQEVTLLPFEYTERGYRVIIDNLYLGMVYKNEIFSPINLGHPIPGFVKEVRPDGLVDVALRPVGIKNLDSGQEEILIALKEAGGFLPLHDKSDPNEIKKVLGMSKQTFKRTIGMLYKARKIEITDKGIKLIK